MNNGEEKTGTYKKYDTRKPWGPTFLTQQKIEASHNMIQCST